MHRQSRWIPAALGTARCGYISAGCKEGSLNAAIGETVSVLALIAVLAWAVIRPRGWPEAVAAGPAAVILIAVGAISFVVDHAACPVLLVWPEAAPDVGTIPPPPHHPYHGGR